MRYEDAEGFDWFKCDLCGDKQRAKNEDGLYRNGSHEFCSSICMNYYLYPTKELYLTGKRQAIAQWRESCDWVAENEAQPSATYTKVNFEPYYEHAIGQHFSSWSDREKKLKAYNDAQDHEKYPRKFFTVHDNHAFTKECQYIHKHRKEFAVEKYRKSRDPASLPSNIRDEFAGKRKTYFIPRGK